ncbi:MAG: HD domain-containing protein [Planctomycetes bacterium]|nr:HD domain-containing protein [Planctomycetota bacterium]
MTADPAALPRPASPVAVIDMGSSAIRLAVAEVAPDGSVRILDRASRSVFLGKDTFAMGRISAPTMEAAVRACEGFRRIMDEYKVSRCRAVATAAVREAANRDVVLDRIRLRTGLAVEVIDGSEEIRLTYTAVRGALGSHEVLASGTTLLVEVGGGSADVSFLRSGEPVFSGTYPLGALRMRQTLASWRGTHARRLRLLRRHIHGVVQEVKRGMPLAEATHFVALGGDVRFAAGRLAEEGAGPGPARSIPKEAFVRFSDEVAERTDEQIVETYGLPLVEAETLVPALLAARELLAETAAERVTVPEASLRDGLLLELVGAGGPRRAEDFTHQVLASAGALGEKYRYDAAHARKVADIAVRLFDGLVSEHGLPARDRLLLEVAALLHDIGVYIQHIGHHKHTHYILSVSDVFGLTRDDMAVVANVARYHRRALPQRAHLPYVSLDRETRVRVNKLAALLRIANALDADHAQKLKDVRLVPEEDAWILEIEGAGDLTMERLATAARADLFLETFGKRIGFRETEPEA